MTTLIPTTSSQPAAGVEAYEDMFKEITRKLYGEESAHGLYPHNTQIAQVAQLAPGAPAAAPEGGERSFTTLVSDRNITTIDYETTTVNDQGQQQQGRSEEHLTTAFGLAALMQNGFPPPGAILNPVNFPAKANLVAVTSDDRWQQQQEQPSGEQSWSGGKHSSTSYSHKPGKKPKVEPLDGSPTGSGSTLNIPQSDKSKGNFSPSSATVGAATGKRYACTSCPYTTDRRDLFTRHENIHKEEKPFHCYACLKQFNRADHVKKHFMRMHRDMDYEIAKTRRITAVSSTSTPTSSTAKPYYSSSSSNTPVSAPAPPPPTTLVSPPVSVIPVVSTLNIPTANFPAQLSIPSSHHGTATIESSSHGSTVTAVINSHNIVTLNGSGLLQHHHQQQQQQNHQQHQPVLQQQQQQQIVVNAPPIVAIKQEKGVQPRAEGAGNSNGSNAANLVDDKSFAKKNKGEKRFTCCYCPWSGADNWGLKRHLNTHTKPYVCMLCDYKAARSERLATHVFKVHNKKACSKCTFFAEDQDQLNAHMQDSHPNEPAKPVKPATSPIGGGSTGNVLRSLGNTFVPNNLHGNNPTSSGNSFGTSVVNNSSTNTTILYQTTASTTAIPSTGNILTNSNASNLIDTINQHLAANGGTVTVVSGNGLGGGVGQVTTPHNHHQQQQNHLQHNQNQNQQQQQIPQQQQQQHHWIAKVHRKRGSELLYSYLEADGSDSEDYARLLSMQALGRNKTSVTQDFHNAGGGTHRQYHANHNSDSNSSSIDSSNDQQTPPSPPLSSTSSSRSPSTSPPVLASATATPNHLSEEHLSLLQLLATAAVAQQHLQLQQQQKSSASSILSSPPASHLPQPPAAIVQNPNQNSTNQAQNDAKRRRKSSSRNDKENLGQKQPNRSVAVGGKVIDLTVTAAAAVAASDTGNGIERNNNSSSNNNNSSVNNKNINEAIFDRVMYKKPSYQNMFLTAAFCKPVLGVEKDPRREDRVIVAEKSFSLAEFLRNHTEVSISTLNSTATTIAKKPNDDEDVIFIKEEKRRKQQAPRKVDQPPSLERSVGDIRDKHMIRLITRRLCCRICQNQHVAPDNCHYHTKTSLILHQRWRHGQGAATNRCQHCGAAFARRYKLALHQKLMHRNRKPGTKKTVTRKKQPRKQRKRKPRSQCFTKRRK